MTDNDTDKKPLHGPNLILDVENFGPIAEAKNIEFRPMTVFVGPSNTGKSYLAMLLHAILQWRRESRYWRFAVRRLVKNPKNEVAFARGMATWKQRWHSHVEANFENESFEVPIRELPNEIQTELSTISNAIAQNLSGAIRKSVRDYFEVDSDSELVSNQVSMHDTPLVDLRVSSDRVKPNSSLRIYADANEHELRSFDITEQTYESLDWLTADEGFDLAMSSLLDDFATSIIENLFPVISSHYLPASRTGIMISHATITDQIVANASNYPLDGAIVAPFHRIQGEFLRKINAIGSGSRSVHRSEGWQHDLACDVERLIIGGPIVVERKNLGLPRFFYERDGFAHPMFKSSSMVTELAPLVLFLRNYLAKDDLLIVEEPESHLHPMAQQRLAAMLTLMVRSGINVLVTTHSDYFVEQVGIFHNASFLDRSVRAEALRCFGADLDGDLFLHENEVGVYGFGSGVPERGTTVGEIPFDQEQWEYGTADHTSAVIDQFNRNARVTEARIAQS